MMCAILYIIEPRYNDIRLYLITTLLDAGCTDDIYMRNGSAKYLSQLKSYWTGQIRKNKPTDIIRC